MKFIYSIIFLILFSSNTFSQIKILSSLNSKIEKYEFYISKGIPCGIMEDPKTGKEIRTLFILNNPETIKQIIKNWKGKKAKDFYTCGYDYIINVVLDDKIVEKIRFNSEVKQVICNSGAFDVEENPFLNLNEDLTFSEYEFETNNINDARAFLEENKNKKGVFIPFIKRYFWANYDGRFFIQISKEKNQKKLKSTKFYESEMHEKFKDDKFIVDFWGCCDTYEAYIYSNVDFWKKFNLYNRKGEYKNIESTYKIYLFGNSLEIEKLIHNNK